ncbi:MAG: hypothetical protein RSE18_07120 [Acinetobacter sp.]
MRKLVYGVGVNDGSYQARCSDGILREYGLWESMLNRCYNPNFHKKQKTYADCTASENFKNYSYFYNWCQNQIGFSNPTFELDKDILSGSSKIYSEDFCIFLPKEINTLLNKQKSKRGNHPIGVSFSKDKGKFKSEFRTKMKRNHIGYFDNPVDAFNAYKIKKEAYIKEVANKYKDQIDPRAYAALINYTIDIND